MDADALRAHLVSANELSAMVCGSSTSWSQAVRLQDVFHVVMDTQLQQQYKMLADVFWEVCRPDKLHHCNSFVLHILVWHIFWLAVAVVGQGLLCCNFWSALLLHIQDLTVQVVNGWSIDLKQQFLRFLTGSDRLPQPGTEVLHMDLPFVAFTIEDHRTMLTRLPQVCLHGICKALHAVPLKVTEYTTS